MKKTLIYISICFSLSVVTVLTLYALSDKLTHKRNSFHRLFPPHPVTRETVLDLTLNSFYLSGSDNDHIYISNVTAPLFLLQYGVKTKDTTRIPLMAANPGGSYFRANTKVQVVPPHFYLTDGITPKILKGNLKDGSMVTVAIDSTFFSRVIALDTNSFVIRAISTKSQNYVLGTLREKQLILHPELLEKQIDGIFCTDGILQYNPALESIIYLYHYRNEYLVMDPDLNLRYKGNTIDTNSKAKIKTVSKQTEGESTLASPPFLVNTTSYSFGKYLFVLSNLMAKNEDRESFNESSVIDVYNLEKQTYEFSFYIADFKSNKVTDFVVTKTHLVALHKNLLISYRLEPLQFEVIAKTFSMKKTQHR